MEEAWNEEVEGSPSFRFGEKLRRLKSKLKHWNWDVFGHIQSRIKNLQREINSMEKMSQNTMSDDDYQVLDGLKGELAEKLQWEHELYRLKTRAKWIQEGDQNTVFFHAMIRERRKRNIIRIEQPNGE